jgi:hypothetical protein
VERTNTDSDRSKRHLEFIEFIFGLKRCAARWTTEKSTGRSIDDDVVDGDDDARRCRVRSDLRRAKGDVVFGSVRGAAAFGARFEPSRGGVRRTTTPGENASGRRGGVEEGSE